jgi:hypothetical protein
VGGSKSWNLVRLRKGHWYYTTGLKIQLVDVEHDGDQEIAILDILPRRRTRRAIDRDPKPDLK